MKYVVKNAAGMYLTCGMVPFWTVRREEAVHYDRCRVRYLARTCGGKVYRLTARKEREGSVDAASYARGIREERARVVAYLRACTLPLAAKEIERGEHTR